MLRVKDIIISESAPNDPKVGWVTTANGKSTLRFNINGVWKDMIEKSDDPEEDIDSYYRILVDPAGGLWLLSIHGDADLNNDEQITDITVVCFSTEESMMRWKFVAGYTVGQYKALTGESISNEINFDDKHQFPLYIDSDLINSAEYGQLEDTDTLTEILQRLWGNCGEGTVRQFTDDYGNIYNVSKVTDSNTVSVIKYIPEEQWVTFLFGSNVSFSDNAAIIAAMNGGSTVTIDLADIQSIVSSTRYGNTDNSSVIIYPNQTVWCSAATETLNVAVNTDGREKSGAMSGVSFLACKPDVTTINFTSGANIVVYPTSPIQFTGSGSKLLQLTFIKK
nr:MAG TPA: hypothetical protein [Crassvirales sp.]